MTKIKKLAFERSGMYPSVILLTINELDVAKDISGDYVFAYNPETMYCIGSAPVSNLNSAYITVFGDDTTTSELENIGIGKEYAFGYYDGETGLYYKLTADLYDMMHNDIPDEPMFRGLGIYTGEEAGALAIIETDINGEPVMVDLQENPEVTRIELSIDVPATWKSGDNPVVPVKVNSKNVEIVSVEVTEGMGVLNEYTKKQWIQEAYYNYVYNVHSADDNVCIKVTGKNVFTNEIIEATTTMDVEHDQYNNVEFENDHIVLFSEGYYLKAASKTGNVLFKFIRVLHDETISTAGLERRDADRGRNQGRG